MCTKGNCKNVHTAVVGTADMEQGGRLISLSTDRMNRVHLSDGAKGMNLTCISHARTSKLTLSVQNKLYKSYV